MRKIYSQVQQVLAWMRPARDGSNIVTWHLTCIGKASHEVA